ncbi:MAG: DUF4920 domain-containing protein [Xanthomonadales bacterium]|nr:DUF4920 domain-containing protein [Xanthomonadales bacterium]
MRLVLALSLLLAMPAMAHEHGAHAEKAPAIAPVQTTADGAVYGATLPANLPAVVALDTVIAEPQALLGKDGAFSGRITEVCQQMGCWMVLATEKGDFVRVTMRDHAFGVPKDASGEAVVYGTLNEKVLSAEEIEHLSKEGAKVPAQRELRIDATSVLIHTAT